MSTILKNYINQYSLRAKVSFFLGKFRQNSKNVKCYNDSTAGTMVVFITNYNYSTLVFCQPTFLMCLFSK